MQGCPQYRRGVMWGLVALVAVAWGIPPGAAIAQGPGVDGKGDRKQNFELLHMWRLVDELEIDEEQAMRVFPAFRRHKVQRDSLERRHRVLLAVIKRQLAEDTEDDALLASMRKVSAAGDEIEDAKKAFQTDLARLLSARQQAKLLLFEMTFRTDLVDLVRRSRGAGGEGPPRHEGMPGRGGVPGRRRGE